MKPLLQPARVTGPQIQGMEPIPLLPLLLGQDLGCGARDLDASCQPQLFVQLGRAVHFYQLLGCVSFEDLSCCLE